MSNYYRIEDKHGVHHIKADDEKQAAQSYVRDNYDLGPYQQIKITVNEKEFIVFTYPK